MALMNFRVEPDLREAFNQAAELNHAKAAQVLRQFMREYVEKTEQAPVKVRSIPIGEKLRRQKAFTAALASAALEGFTVTPEYEAQGQRFINGEIEFADLTKFLHDHAGQ